MNHLKISTRLTLLIGLLALALLALGGLCLFGMNRSAQSLKSMYEDRTVAAAQLAAIRASQLRTRLDINIALVSGTAEVAAERAASIEANTGIVARNWEAYRSSQMTAEEDKLVQVFAEQQAQFADRAERPIVTALRAADFKEVARLNFERARPLGTAMDGGLDALIQLQVDAAKTMYAEAVKLEGRLRMATTAAIALGLALAVAFGYSMVRSIGRQLGAEPGEAAGLARAVASGDLDVRVALRPGDADSLMAQLKTMQDSLSRVVSHVRQNADSVATASVQISQGNTDLSARTEEQASALQQTAASMEQLSSAVKHNAENARRASELARDASSIAAQGGDVVGQVVETMKGINESSRKIADIIGVIDGIAFQTNILALNAAVEAARAGEQGRGFAVVAGEVRGLAGRSAEAAKEIKDLIGASVERVEHGTALVDQAGQTMAEVVGSIRKVSDIVGQISTASAEQSAGVVQVGEAVSQMDQATQQNAALVEQSAAAADSLKQQAQQLVEAVSVFRLNAGPALAAA